MPTVTSPDESKPLPLGRFTLFRRESRLMLDDRQVPLGPRSLDVLLALARRTGTLVSKAELLELVWPGQAVEEGNIAVQVHALRKVLGNELIATVPGRGYRLALPIDAPTAAAADARMRRRRTDGPGSEAVPGLLTRLPRVLSPLVGREDDVGLLASMLDRHRLVSIIGPGGVGKTLLA